MHLFFNLNAVNEHERYIRLIFFQVDYCVDIQLNQMPARHTVTVSCKARFPHVFNALACVNFMQGLRNARSSRSKTWFPQEIELCSILALRTLRAYLWRPRFNSLSIFVYIESSQRCRTTTISAVVNTV